MSNTMERPASNSISHTTGSRPQSSSSMLGAASHHHTRSMSRTAANAIASLSSHGNATIGSSATKPTAHSSSNSISSFSTSSTQSLFLQTLRHLGLDQLYDSPTLTISSLASDARTRIRTAEWSLYQLFRLYDPAVTAEKLQPFFPPLEPLQSVNLRAALYRCLNELKKDGLLGRDTVLRKSLLDECAGDKFWELCVVFAAVVLRKVVSDPQRAPHAAPLAMQLATTQTLSKADRESMLPLAVAHKKALMKVLEEKQRRRARYHRLSGVLTEAEEGLASRSMLAEQRTRSGQGKLTPQQTEIAESVLQTQWTGSEELRDALLDGDEDAAKDSIFTRPFETVWEANEQDQLFSPLREDASILEDLEFRTRHQRQRLRKWQTFHEKLAALRPLSANKDNTQAKATTVRFDRHHDLRVDEDVDASAAPSERQERNTSASRYDEILTAMREELRKNHTTRKPSEPQQIPPHTRKPSYRTQSVALDTASPVSPHEGPARSPSQTTVPIIRPGMSRRVSSQSRSYHQPKVVSQREPIPLKSEIFSPLRSRQSSASPLSSTPFATSPAIEDGDTLSVGDVSLQQRDRHYSDGHGHADSAVGLKMDDHAPPNEIRSNSPKTVRWSTSSSSQADSGVDLPNRPILRSGSNGSSSAHDARRMARPSSLTERTRMSMALSSSIDSPSPAVDDPSIAQTPSSTSDEPASLPEISSTLAERTRYSMSLAPQPTLPRTTSSKHRKSQSAQTRSYPVNQFETPPRKDARPSLYYAQTEAEDDNEDPAEANGHTVAGAESAAENEQAEAETEVDERTLTPREQLFDDDAAYASVFKSRPRIALSPVLSPTRAEFSQNASDDGGDTVSSPLTRA